MEHEAASNKSITMNYGVILGAIMVLISVTMYATGMALEGKQWPVFLYYIIFPIVIIYGINQYKKLNANSLNLGQAMKVGLKIAVISGLIFALYSMLFHYVIDPEFGQQSLDVARDKMLENPNMTEEMVDQSMEWAEKFSNPILGGAFWIVLSTIFGAIYSLIGGLVMKTE